MLTNGLDTVLIHVSLSRTLQKSQNFTASTGKQVITDVNPHISSFKGL